MTRRSIHDIYMTRRSIHDANQYAFIHDAGHGAVNMTQMNMYLYMTQGTVQSIFRYPGHHEELYHIRFNASGVQVCVCVSMCVKMNQRIYLYIDVHVLVHSCVYLEIHAYTHTHTCTPDK